MEHIVYPVVLYYNKEEETYTVAFHDLDIYTEGETVEKAFLKAKDFLEAYCDCVVKFEEDFEKASDYVKVAKEHKSNIVLLVESRS